MLSDPQRIKAAAEIAILRAKYFELRDQYKVGNAAGVYSYKPDATPEQRAATDAVATPYFEAKAAEAPKSRAAETVALNAEMVRRSGRGMFL